MAMTSRDATGKYKQIHCLGPVAITTNTTTTSAIVDTSGYRSCTFLFHMGNWTDGVYTPLVNESDSATMVGESATADADFLPSGTGQEAAIATAIGADDAVAKLGYRGDKTYVTCDIVSTGTSSGTAGLSVVALLEGAIDEPVA